MHLCIPNAPTTCTHSASSWFQSHHRAVLQSLGGSPRRPAAGIPPGMLTSQSPNIPASPRHSDDGMLGLPPAPGTVPVHVADAPEVSTLRRASTGAPGGILLADLPEAASGPAGAAPRRNPLSRMSAAPAMTHASPPASARGPGSGGAARPRPSLSRASCPVSNGAPRQGGLSRTSARGNVAQPRSGLTRASLRRNSVVRAGTPLRLPPCASGGPRDAVHQAYLSHVSCDILGVITALWDGVWMALSLVW